jgi:hypothetical protein
MSAKKQAKTTPSIGVVYWEAGGEQGPQYRLIEGFKDPEEARRFTNWSGRNSQALRSRVNGEQVAVVEVVDLATALAEGDKDRTAEWRAHDTAWREELRQQEEDARKAHEARLAAEEAARREAEIQRLIDLQLKRELEERKARWRAAAEAELEQRELGDAA